MTSAASGTNRPADRVLTDLGSPIAVGVVFTVSGFVMGANLSRIPQIRDQVAAVPSQLAFALVCVGIGSVGAMPFTARLVDRFGSAAVVRAAAVIALVAWLSVAFTSSIPVLAVQMLFIGMGVGVWDVAMNVQGHLVEQRRGAVLMPSWHGFFSVGGVIGALGGAGAAALGITLSWQLPVVSVLSMVVVIVATRPFLPDAGLHSPTEHPPTDAAEAAADLGDPGRRHHAGELTAETVPEPTRARRSTITRLEILLGIITLATALAEGAANDWLALALVDSRGAPESLGALTYAGFNLTMAIGRFAGGPVIARFGRVIVLRVAGTIAAGGIVLLCLVNNEATALIGAAAWGLGLSVVFPSAMSAAGDIPGRGGRAIAVVSTIGYAGFLLGAPMVGFLAHSLPLDRALLAVAAVCLLIPTLAFAAKERTFRE